MLRKIFTLLLLLLSSATLAATTHVIPEVNAKAKQTHKKSITANAQSTSISHDDISASPPVNLSAVLRQEQSVIRLTNASGDNNQTTVSIRGFGDNAAANSLILIDGFPFTNPTLLAPNINALALEDIDNIDIYQGSQGSLWGDQAVGGVLLITTRHPKHFIANLNASGGSFNQQYASALLGNQMKNGISLKGFILTDSTNNYREHNYQQMHSGLGQIGFTYARGNIDLTLRDYTTTTFLPGGLSQTQYDSNPRQATNFTNFGHYHTSITTILSKHAFNDNWLVETRLLNQSINGDGRVNIPFTRNEWEWLFNPRLIGHLQKNKLILGYNAQSSHFHMNNRTVDDTVNELQQDIYAQMTFPFTDNLKFILGGREAWQKNQIEKQTNPTVNASDSVFVSEQGLQFNPNKHWQLYARRDGNFSFPKANQQTWTPAGTTYLQPQTGMSYEAGTMWLTEKNKTQLSAYQLQLHNEIAFNPAQTPTEPFGSYQNFQKTNRNGITLSETYYPIELAKLNTQINYVDARFASGEFSGKQIPAVPAINLNLGLSCNWTERWQTKYYAIYNGSTFASEDNNNIGKKLPGYWINNIALQYQLTMFTASFEIDNLFNQTYSMYTVYDTDSGQNTYYPGSGRSYMLTMKAELG